MTRTRISEYLNKYGSIPKFPSTGPGSRVWILENGILLPKLFRPTVRKNCSSDREKLFKFEAVGREFAKKNLTVGQNNFGNKIPMVLKVLF